MTEPVRPLEALIAQPILERIKELLHDVYDAHRDPDDHDSDWQQAEDVPCAWCDGAKAVLKCIDAALLQAAAPPAPTVELPKRDAKALIESLRIRALALTGEAWERTATRDMMKEAAQMLEDYADAQTDVVGDLQAYGQEEETAALKRKDRMDYQFWAGWNAALQRIQKPVPAAPPERVSEGKERKLCSRCEGNGVIKIHHGVRVCPRCQGDCWEPAASPAVEPREEP
jgi:hypothetical protein